MSNKWLVCSCIATGGGLLSGAFYLLFSEYSVFSDEQLWGLNSLWSTVLLWAFSVLFLLALLFNILAFLELERQEELLNPLAWVNDGKDAPEQLHYEQSTALFLKQLKQEMVTFELQAPYYLMHDGKSASLLYIQTDAQDSLTISMVRSLFQQMLKKSCQRGVIVTNQRLSSQVKLFANEAGIELLDHAKLSTYLAKEEKGDLVLI